MQYKFFTQGETPQTQPLPGREMIRGRSGGVMFDAGLWAMLRRCLLLGTAENTFYAGKHELTQEFVHTVRQAVYEDPQRVAAEILYASEGRSINNSAPLLALVLLSMGSQPQAKQAFMEIFPQVVRTGSHFYEWLSYTKSMRGFGKMVRDAGRAWLSDPDAHKLAYQLLKYQQRSGFSHRDALRLFHVKPASDDHQALFAWATQGWAELPEEIPSAALAQIWWYEWLKRHPDQTHEAIAQGHLTHEMAAPVGTMDQQAWQLLFNEMPIGAMLRNLGSLTHLGVLGSQESANLERVHHVLTSREHLKKGRIHPLDILKALKTYASGGEVGRSQKKWQPVSRILNVLETALERSFEVLDPTGAVIMHAVDISGSMGFYTVPGSGILCSEIAAVMALATAKAEPNYAIRGFDTEFRDLDITAKNSFQTAMKKTSSRTFGATDAGAAYRWMRRSGFFADVVVFWTDSESWAGSSHTSEALQKYRQKVNPNVKAIYVTLIPSHISLVDPQDPYSWDLGGFDPSLPRVIQMIAAGEV